ncbi:GntR family transcriptional regulator [Acidothermaceae bacterium B102]|nr:GntR family transcriptional regulator [Acidothermaceae bacterium B102]
MAGQKANAGEPVQLGLIATVQHATLLWLRQRIAEGHYQPGTQLRQENLAREFGVSVPPVREALKTLEAEGLVLYVPRRGYFIAQLTVGELQETYVIRDLLESDAIARAVGALARDDIARMRQCLRDMENAHRSDDVALLTTANRRFHFTLFEGAGLPRMSDLIRVLWDGTDRYRSVYFTTPAHRRRVNAEHRAIMAAVAKGDGTAAVELSRAHREHALTALVGLLSHDAAASSPRAARRATP